MIYKLTLYENLEFFSSNKRYIFIFSKNENYREILNTNLFWLFRFVYKFITLNRMLDSKKLDKAYIYIHGKHQHEAQMMLRPGCDTDIQYTRQNKNCYWVMLLLWESVNTAVIPWQIVAPRGGMF